MRNKEELKPVEEYPDIMMIREASDMLRMDNRTLKSLVNQKVIPAMQPSNDSRSWRFNKAAVLRVMGA